MKRTFVVPDDKEEIYEKYKEIVPEVSSDLMKHIESTVMSYEAEQSKMVVCKAYKKAKHDYAHDVFVGQEFRFYGQLMAEGTDCNTNDLIKVYLTRKRQFLVCFSKDDTENHVMYFNYTGPYETFNDLKAAIPHTVAEDCRSRLGLDNPIRDYEFLDV